MSRPTKRRKTDKLAEIELLEIDLGNAIQQGDSLNSLADLLKITITSKNNAEQLHKAIYALYRVFSLIISKNRIYSTPDTIEEEVIVRKWLMQRLDQYFGLLCSLINHEEPQIKNAARKIAFSLIKSLSSSLSSSTGYPQICSRFFRLIVPELLGSEDSTSSLLDYVNMYDDIRWYTLREITTLLGTTRLAEHPLLLEHILFLLERLNSMPQTNADIKSFYFTELANRPLSLGTQAIEDKEDGTEDDWRAYFDADTQTENTSEKLKDLRASQLSTHQSLHSLNGHRVQFSNTWFAILPFIKNSEGFSARVLTILHRSILPHLTKPLQLMDWIGSCVEFDGAVSLLAFNALFILIRDHNLDYPDFYTRLYAILDHKMLHVKYRARFFRLLDLFLSSTHLPATTLASFAKRLSRLSLTAPPAAIVMIVPFVYNILKRHPSLMVLVHRESILDQWNDPFLPDEPSPLLTKAIESSLWELNSHTQHYAPPVSTLTRILSEPFTKPSYLLEEFLDHTYGTLYSADAKRKITGEPALALSKPDSIFQTPVDSLSKPPCSLWHVA